MSIITKKHYRSFCVSIICLTVLSIASNCFAVYPYEFELNCPYWFMLFNRADYMDITFYYPSPRHQITGYHEMMTGDLAVAVFYQNINEDNKAEWLTDSFVWPTFGTGSPFDFNDYDVSNDPCNPVWTDQNQPTGYIPGSNSYSIGSTGNDTGWSTLDDGKLAVKIFYEVVDLGEQDANGVGGSPLAFRDTNDTPVFIYSERYILLLTYVFKNLQEVNDINNLEFYQMMHGHPADAYSNLVGCYETANFYDPLADYIPYDPNHQTGANFRYDITLYNIPYSGSHIDYMSFSSTIEPNVVDFNEFENSSSAMRNDVENRDLNGRIYWENDDMAGAAKWNLGNLEPNETKSITLALMYGVGPIQTESLLPITLTKTDDINDCISPSIDGFMDNYINYSIAYSFACDINEVNIIDYLPDDVEYYSSVPAGIYDPCAHTVCWNLGDIDIGQYQLVGGTFGLKVKVLESAPQGGTLTNTVNMYSGQYIIKTATEQTQVCCDYTIIYVDKDAVNGANNGSNWDNAYIELRDALVAVRNGVHGCANEIWVAEGIYKPTNDANLYNETFAMIDSINMYGHFEGWETSICQRNLADANNDTILSGDIDDDNDIGDVANIVIAASARLDGFTVKKGYESGIYSSNCSPTIASCVFKNNYYYGIYCTDGSYLTIINTFVNNNGSYGIRCHGQSGHPPVEVDIDRCTVVSNPYSDLYASFCTVNARDSVFSNSSNCIYAYSCDLTVERCDISDNTVGIGFRYNTHTSIKKCIIQRNSSYYGIAVDSDNSDTEIMSNVICDNGTGIVIQSSIRLINNLIYSNNSDGISCYTSNSLEICNNTIVYNGRYGIGYGNDPNINGNIIYYNTSGQLNGSFTKINYNCIQDYTETNGNINDAPEFLNGDVNDYHLTDDSNCINAGDPNFTPDANETDIDGEARIMLNRVDIGADEFYRSAADFNNDGFVNFFDFAVIAGGWQDSFDISDLALLCEEWLWLAGWNLDNGIGGEGAYFAGASCETGGEMMMMQSQSESLTTEPFNVEETLKWLDEIWQSDKEISETISEKDWAEFIESVKNSQ